MHYSNCKLTVNFVIFAAIQLQLFSHLFIIVFSSHLVLTDLLT